MFVNLCILGPSAVGKSPLDYLFHRNVVTIEPYRARIKGARKGEMYFVSPPMINELLLLNNMLDKKPILSVDSNEDKSIEQFKAGNIVYPKFLKVYKRASFFKVRETDQVLLHNQKIANHRKIEIFGPILSLILKNNEARIIIPFLENVDITIFLLLNPLEKSILSFNPSQIIDMAGWRRKDWQEIQIKRDKVKGKTVDLNEINDRINFMPVEATSWRDFATLAKQDSNKYGFIEPLNWSHFEYKYLENENQISNTELNMAKSDILEAAKKVGLNDIISGFMSNKK